jgi:hypothetical protein
MANGVLRWWRRLRYGRPIVVVSGLPRSGTSMAMRMLEAGGLATVADNVRTADEDNPRGYFEDERVKDLEQSEDKGWLRAARGRSVKVVSSLLKELPADNNYRVLFMRRKLEEVLASQKKMLERRGEAADTGDDKLLELYRGHLEKVEIMLRLRPQFEVLYLDYSRVVESPRGEAERIASFLEGRLDVERMAAAVEAQLYRNRA